MGAFGAHGLRSRLSPEMLSIWQTGVLYHLLHALALFSLALYGKSAGVRMAWGAGFFLAGMLIFSGSLYFLSLTGFRPLGAITPIGGLCFLLGWGWIFAKLPTG